MQILIMIAIVGLVVLLAVLIAYHIHAMKMIYRVHQIEKGAKEATKYMKGYIEQK